MIVDEAATLRCPFMTHCTNQDQAFNAKFAVMEHINCIHVHCMAWDVWKMRCRLLHEVSHDR